MKLRSYRSAPIRNKTVLYRAAYDITLAPRGNGWIVPDDTRIRETLPTLRWLLSRCEKVVILSWLGRPKKANDPKYRMDPIARRLSTLLRRPVLKLDDCIGPSVDRAIAAAKPGSVILLENVRFHPEEDKNNRAFAKALTKNADLIVNDAFAQCHRKVASIVGITEYLDAYAGPLLEREVGALGRVLERPRRPFVAIMGGGKLSTKAGLIKVLLRRVDALLLGGALANAIFSIKGIQIGRSLNEPGVAEAIKGLSLTNRKLKLPIDVVVSRDAKGKRGCYRRPVGNVRPDEFILDIGPDTVSLFNAVLKKASLVVWNGPLGYTENAKFAYGTREVGKALVRGRAESIVGGGDTLAALHQAKLLNRVSYASTAGGAMLEFLERGTLPGLETLRSR